MNTLSINTTASHGPTPLPPAGATAGGPSDKQPRASAPPLGPAAITPSGGESRPSQSAPDPHVPSSDELVASAKKIFGDKLEYIRLNDERIPKILRYDFQGLKITELGEFLAVACGPPSNLAVLVLPFINKELPEYHAFIDLNPKLKKSLITSWNSVLFLWIRIDGWRPANRALHRALWLINGLVPTIVERVTPNGKKEFQKSGDSIVSIKFSDLKWPDEIHELFQLEQIESIYGKLIQQTGSRKLIINYRMAAAFLANAMDLFYDTNSDSFYIRQPGESKLKPFSKTEVNTAISFWLQSQEAKSSVKFPAGDHVKRIVDLIKVARAIECPGELEGLNKYLCEHLELRSGINLTTTEIFTSYFEFCKTTRTDAYPECAFLDMLPKVIRRQFGKTKVHNVMRHHAKSGKMTARYGFNGLGIKSNGTAEAKEAKEAKEAGEHPEGGIKEPSQDDSKFLSQITS